MADTAGAVRRGLTSPALRAVRRPSRAILIALYSTTVSLGALATPLTALLLVSPLLALLTIVLYLPAYRSRLHDRPPGQHILTAGFTGAGLRAFVSGAQLLGVLGAAASLSVLALAVVVLGAHLVEADPLVALRRRPAAGDEAALRALLRRAPLQMLFRRWHTTGRTVAAASSQQDYQMAVYLRELLLDELHTRDPAGAQRWIDQGGTQSPERHIHSDQDLPGPHT